MSVRLKVEKNLQESENRFRSLSDAAFEGILITRKTKILDANMTLEKLFGYTKEEVISVKATNFVVPEERENVLNKVLSGYEEPYETLGLKKDGTIIPIEVHAKKISYRGQEARVTAIRDLTKQRKAEEEIKKLQGLLPICSSCKKIRDDSGYWNRIEEYIQKHSDAKFSHGICPECSDKLYGKEDWYIEMKNEEQQKK